MTVFQAQSDPIIETADDQTFITPDGEVFLNLTGDQERELAFTSVTMVDEHMHFCRFQSNDLSRARENCPDGYIIAQGNSKYYVMLKI